MDTQNSAVAEIPNFKLAKVGKGRERKRGGAAWFGARGAGAGFSGAAGGSGAGFAGLAGMSVGKIVLALLVAGGVSVSVGAWQLGRSHLSGSAAGSPAAKKLFSDKAAPQYGDTSNVLRSENSIPNSLGFISGSTDGLTPEQRAKKQAAEAEAARKAAEAEAARVAAEDAKNKADGDAAKKNGADGKNPADSGIMAGGGDLKKSLSAGKFGRLGSFGNSGSGGGLAGGAGLSGGINRNFAAPTPAKGQNGAMAAMHNPTKPGFTSGARSVAARSASKGFAKRQLDNAFAQSKNASTAGKTEAAAASAAAPFDNNAGQGSIIAGPGVSAGGPQSGTADGGTPATTGNGGGPVSSTGGGAACSAGMAPDVNGACQSIATPGAKNAASYQWMVTLAEALLAILMIFAILVMVCKGKAWLEFVAEWGSMIIGVLGGIICALGVAIMAMSGDKMMGGIFAAVGGFVAATAMFPSTLALGGEAAVNVAASALIAAAVGSLGASAASASSLK
jgi:hypothetical protein